MADITARYEFRVWAENLGGLRDQFQRLAAPGHTEASKETYLISAASDRCNAKIRDGMMDIKILIDTDRGLEQWKPVLKADFPLESSIIAAQIFPSLELETPRLCRAQYLVDEFLDQVVCTQPRIAIVPVAKTRLQFSLNTCQAEWTSVTISDVTRETVALESENPDAVLQLIRQLKIDGATNTSYVRQIKQLLGK
jgi:exopolyphosphatase/guanosine-5'-triphosphate,3'-diphosphate pyrophosphatase